MSAPPAVPARILASWLIGSDASCDIVVSHPTVSGRHCRLVRDEARLTLEDLGSTNGTYVDHVRLPVRQPTVVRREQHVLLGPTVTLPWPALGPALPTAHAPGIIRIGRSHTSDVVLDYPMVSWDHARIVETQGQWVIEDLGSSNGTAINKVQNRVDRAVLHADDDVYLGSFKIAAARLLSRERVVMGKSACAPVAFGRDSLVIGRDPNCDHPIDHAMVSWHHARLWRTPAGMSVEDLGSLNGTFVDGRLVVGRVAISAGQEIEIGTERFRLLADGALERRGNKGNVSIQAVDLSVDTPAGQRLLDPLSLTIYPSELVALMGPAGAGKTTLLRALNGYARPARGTVLFNGTDLYRFYNLFRHQMGYVPQDDIVHSQLTVREALYFAARLRTDLSDREIDDRIDVILDSLGILDRKNSIVGSPEHKVLSGGQRKRVNIALELISDTPVLFLDEPTSGLSSYDAAGVVELLKRLSQQGKTIVATIHQPSTDVFKRFDNLIMISRDTGGTGALAYFGPAYPDATEFFKHGTGDPAGDAGHAAAADGARGGETQLNPEMLLTGLARQSTPAWAASYSASRYRKQFVDDRADNGPDYGGGGTRKRRAGLGVRQWATLTRRNFVLKFRDRAQVVILLLQAPLFGALIVLVFGVLAKPEPLAKTPAATPLVAMQTFAEVAANLVGIEFLLVVAAIWFGCNNAARDIVGEWTVYQRERMVNLALPSYVSSKFSVAVVLCVCQCLTLLAIVHVFCDLEAAFLPTAGTLILASLVGSALGLAISSRSSTTESAIALLPIVLLPIIALGGGIRAVYKMPEPAHSLSLVVPSRWALEANMVREAQARPCGYLPGVDRWDACAGGGVDLATAHFPDAIDEREGGRRAVAPAAGATLRFSSGQTTAALATMMVGLLGLVLVFLRMRDVH